MKLVSAIQPHALLDRLVGLRKLTDWAPLIVVSALSGDYLRLSLIVATAISAGNILADALFMYLGRVKVWPKLLDVCFFVVYGVTLILAYTIPDRIVARWMQVITTGGLLLLLSLAFAVGRPFTADIAKEMTPEERWETSPFKRTNIILTSVWIAIFFIQVISYLIVALCNANGRHDSGVNIAFNYVIPLGALAAGLIFTKWHPAHVRAAYQRQAQHAGVTQQPGQEPADLEKPGTLEA